MLVAAEKKKLGGELEATELLLDGVEHGDRGVDDFGADSISGVERDAMSFHGAPM